MPLISEDTTTSSELPVLPPDMTNSFDILIEEYEDTDRGEWQNPALVLDELFCRCFVEVDKQLVFTQGLFLRHA